ncbi:hypothetical protein Gotri_024005 [Gossypium trilobum]|uniref:DUF7745 domain-containing protein n=1 Tax=Gossypium trilobum TaxID=34281 RepID=A0A7J9DKR6_9ROSI|nr:hypothetical protein [Gossypium trilobum]
MDKHLFRALAQFWNPAYSCFTFRGVDLVPTVEEYMALLCCSKIQVDKAYSRANLKDLILAHPNTKKKVDVFALSVYGLVVFPKALSHVDEAITDLFDRLDKRVTPVPNFQGEDIKWRVHWMLPDEILYRCGDFDSVPLLGIWGAIGYASLLTRWMKRLAVGPVTTPEYIEWWGKRINDNIPGPSQ